ncbi:hypothetical protein Tco_1312482 [Tanacetum coccineum]
MEDDEESDEHEQVKADYSDKLKRYLVVQLGRRRSAGGIGGRKGHDQGWNRQAALSRGAAKAYGKAAKRSMKALNAFSWSRVTTVSIKNSIAGTYYYLCSVSAAGYKDTTAADLQLFEDLLLSRG